mgnify:CR=1 FL=1
MPSRDGARAKGRPTTDEIYRIILERIVTLKYKPNEVFPEREIAEEFGVSRTPIREVFSRLEAHGLVVVVPHHGTRVSPVDLGDFKEVMQVKVTLDGMAAELATAYVRPEEVAALRDMLNRLDSGEDVSHEDLVRIDQEFHRALWRRANNRFLETLLEGINVRVSRVWYMYLRQTGEQMTDNVRNLHRVLDAFERKDTGAARQAMEDHVMHFFEIVRDRVFALK